MSRRERAVKTLNRLKQILINHATGEESDDNEYQALRSEIIANKTLYPISPKYLRNCRDLSEFWSFIKAASPNYAGRRTIIRESLESLFEHVEALNQGDDPVKPPSDITPDYIREEWEKAISRKASDPRGAITSARTLLEATCKHILTKHGISYSENAELPKLYGACASALTLHPSQHTKDIFKEILSGIMSVVKGMGSMRNKLGDAHAAPIASPKPAPRHSALAVNISCSLAMFLLETDIAHRQKLAGKNKNTKN
jgi:hypothetical protein